MARDLAIPPVAVQPVNSGGGSSSTGEQHQDDDVEEVEEADEGEVLYRQFLARRMAEERLMDNGIGSMEDVRRRGRRRRTEIEGQTTSRQVAAREEVREDLVTLAERFARSEGREAVRRRAEQVELGSITQDNFSQLLSELFHDGGITQERILVLFFFCSDLALRALRAGLRATLSKLTRWSVAFLRGTVAAWVRYKGGWNQLFSGNTNHRQVLLLGASLVLVCLLVVYKRHR